MSNAFDNSKKMFISVFFLSIFIITLSINSKAAYSVNCFVSVSSEEEDDEQQDAEDEHTRELQILDPNADVSSY